MGQTNSLLGFKILDAADCAVAQTSLVTSIVNLDNVGIQVDFASANAAGVLSVEVSANYKRYTPTDTRTAAGTWVTLTTETLVAGQPAIVYFDLTQLSAPWIRLSWAPTAGTGSLTATITGKKV